jgi:hypothetical protein
MRLFVEERTWVVGGGGCGSGESLESSCFWERAACVAEGTQVRVYSSSRRMGIYVRFRKVDVHTILTLTVDAPQGLNQTLLLLFARATQVSTRHGSGLQTNSYKPKLGLFTPSTPFVTERSHTLSAHLPLPLASRYLVVSDRPITPPSQATRHNRAP